MFVWKLAHVLFGWDYVQWKNIADSGVARVHVDGMGRPYYWRYKNTRVLDLIKDPRDVVWLTCAPNKYFYEANKNEHV